MKNKLFGHFIQRGQGRTTLSRQLRVLLAGVLVPFILMLAALLWLLFSFDRAYNATLQNATTAGEFSNDFKENIDLQMYRVAVGNSGRLPLEELGSAREVLRRLAGTTTKGDNQWRIRSMRNLAQRLQNYMLALSQTEGYDARMEQLDNNIYLITALIESYMHDYIYDELRDLAALQAQLHRRMGLATAAIVCLSALVALLVLFYAWHVSRGITRPIKELCGKARRLGEGDFTAVPIATGNVEIKTLDDGFNEMMGRINGLLASIERNQKALRKAELELLQAQINPHFLYNTFDSIIWLAECHKDAEVIQMVASLSTFFRNSLSKGRDIITLGSEEAQVRSYLEIQRIRYRDILEYFIEIPEGIKGCRIAKLTLQPLVENAIYHGIKNKRGGGKITVRGREEGGDLLLDITDDGAGMDGERLRAVREGLEREGEEGGAAGLGLANVHKRLRLYYGAGYGLTLASAPGQGTTVTVRLPRQSEKN